MNDWEKELRRQIAQQRKEEEEEMIRRGLSLEGAAARLREKELAEKEKFLVEEMERKVLQQLALQKEQQLEQQLGYQQDKEAQERFKRDSALNMLSSLYPIAKKGLPYLTKGIKELSAMSKMSKLAALSPMGLPLLIGGALLLKKPLKKIGKKIGKKIRKIF